MDALRKSGRICDFSPSFSTMNLMELCTKFKNNLLQGDQTCEIAGKAEIPDQSDHTLWWFLARKGKGKTWQKMSRASCVPPTAIPALITLQLCSLGRKEPRQKLKHGTWVGFPLLPNDYVAHLPNFCAFWLPSRWSYRSLLKVFFIP